MTYSVHAQTTAPDGLAIYGLLEVLKTVPTLHMPAYDSLSTQGTKLTACIATSSLDAVVWFCAAYTYNDQQKLALQQLSLGLDSIYRQNCLFA